MARQIPRADAQQAVTALLGDRIATALADLDTVALDRPDRTHWASCWRHHTPCLAARIRRTLTGEDPTP